jgi:hypothetical protein|tara:strand:+ start:4259 stop:5551 length:1293 start_codon:yes stop_codon:yes gene_type:complete
MELEKRFLKITSTSGSGDYTYQNNRTVEFQISGVGKAILPELRLVGNIQVRNAGANVTMANEINLNANCGLSAVIRSLRIRSLGLSAKIIEEIQDYPRLCAMVNCMLHGKDDFDNELSHTEYSRGYGVSSVNNLNNANHLGSNPTAPAVGKNAYDVAQRKALISDGSFALRLTAGMLMSNNVDLQEIQGLSISIDLNDPKDVFWGSDSANVTYTLTNLKLMVPVVDDRQPPNPNPSFNFLSFVSTKKNLTSTSQTTSDSLNLTGILGLTTNYLPLGYSNNSAKDGQALYNPCLKQIQYLLDGQRFPLNTPMTTKYNTAVQPPAQLHQSSEVLRNALSSLKPYKNYSKSGVGVDTNSWKANEQGWGSFITGCSFDQVSGLGVNLNNASFQVESQQELRTPDGTEAINYKAYNYYLTRQQVDIVNNTVEVSV